MPVHLYGGTCDMTELMKLARRHDLFVIEDCAEAIGTRHGGTHVGTFGVNRRSIGTPYRRAKGTPLQLRGLVDAGRVFRAAGGVGRA